MQSFLAVQHVLESVISRIPHIRFRVDCQPRLALCGQNVLSVKVGDEHEITVRGGRKRPEQVNAIPDQAGIKMWPVWFNFHLELVRPVVTHFLQ